MFGQGPDRPPLFWQVRCSSYANNRPSPVSPLREPSKPCRGHCLRCTYPRDLDLSWAETAVKTTRQRMQASETHPRLSRILVKAWGPHFKICPSSAAGPRLLRTCSRSLVDNRRRCWVEKVQGFAMNRTTRYVEVGRHKESIEMNQRGVVALVGRLSAQAETAMADAVMPLLTAAAIHHMKPITNNMETSTQAFGKAAIDLFN